MHSNSEGKIQVNPHSHTHIYIYIYIYIVLYYNSAGATKSLCGYVTDQVQYNMESAQYLEKSYWIIIIINKYMY